jgi:hypothetical protein
MWGGGLSSWGGGGKQQQQHRQEQHQQQQQWRYWQQQQQQQERSLQISQQSQQPHQRSFLHAHTPAIRTPPCLYRLPCLICTATPVLPHLHVQTYTLTLTTQYEGSTGTHSESLTLLAVGSPLSVNLTGPSGTVPLKGSGLVYDAQGSVDPDDPFNTGGS